MIEQRLCLELCRSSNCEQTQSWRRDDAHRVATNCGAGQSHREASNSLANGALIDDGLRPQSLHLSGPNTWPNSLCSSFLLRTLNNAYRVVSGDRRSSGQWFDSTAKSLVARKQISIPRGTLLEFHTQQSASVPTLTGK